MSPFRGSVIDAAVVQTLLGYGLPLVVLVMFASAAGVPTGVPIMVVLLMAGAYLVDSMPWLALAILLVALAELAGTVMLHLIAKNGGGRLLERLSHDRQERVHATFDRWRGRLGGRDVATIAVLRLIPVVRMGTTIGTGLIGIRLRDFVLGSAAAALIWTGLPLTLGYTFRSRLETLESYYAYSVSALPMMLGVTCLVLVTTVLIKSPATRGRIRAAMAPMYPPFRDTTTRLPLAEIPQEATPVVH